MRCPFCGHDDTQVKDSRPTEDSIAIRRRRACGACGQRFTTIERVQLRELVVIKSDARRVPFDRDKLALALDGGEAELARRLLAAQVHQCRAVGGAGEHRRAQVGPAHVPSLMPAPSCDELDRATHRGTRRHEDAARLVARRDPAAGQCRAH